MDIQTQTSFTSLEQRSSLNRHTEKTNFIQLVDKNELLFKNYLLVARLLKTEQVDLAKLGDKLLLRLVNMCLSGETSHENEQLDREILAYLLNEYRSKIDPGFCMLDESKLSAIEKRQDLKNLIRELNDSEEKENSFGLRKILQNITNLKSAVNYMIRRLNDQTYDYGLVSTLVSLFKATKKSNEFDEKVYRVMLDIIRQIISLAKEQFDINAKNALVDEFNFRTLLNDLNRLIEMNLDELAVSKSETIVSFEPNNFACMEEEEEEDGGASMADASIKLFRPIHVSTRVLATLGVDESRRFRPVLNDESDCSSDDDNDDNNTSVLLPRRRQRVGKLNIRKPNASKFDPCRMQSSVSVSKLPGIGRVYAERLKAKSLGTLGDLCALYERTCARDDLRFEHELKQAACMRTDVIRKCVDIVHKCLSLSASKVIN